LISEDIAKEVSAMHANNIHKIIWLAQTTSVQHFQKSILSFMSLNDAHDFLIEGDTQNFPIASEHPCAWLANDHLA